GRAGLDGRDQIRRHGHVGVLPQQRVAHLRHDRGGTEVQRLDRIKGGGFALGEIPGEVRDVAVCGGERVGGHGSGGGPGRVAAAGRGHGGRRQYGGCSVVERRRAHRVPPFRKCWSAEGGSAGVPGGGRLVGGGGVQDRAIGVPRADDLESGGQPFG